MRLHGELARGCRRQPDVDHVDAYGLKRANHDVVKHRAGHATVASHDDRSAWMTAERPCTECGSVGRDNLGGQGFANATANSRYADHQSSLAHPASGRAACAGSFESRPAELS